MKNHRYSKEELFLIAAALRKFRCKKRLTQQEVADRLEISRPTYSYYEIGKTMPSVFMLLKLSRLFAVSLERLLENTDYSYLEPYIRRKNQGNPTDIPVTQLDISAAS